MNVCEVMAKSSTPDDGEMKIAAENFSQRLTCLVGKEGAPHSFRQWQVEQPGRVGWKK
jgi:hypothetical protein